MKAEPCRRCVPGPLVVGPHLGLWAVLSTCTVCGWRRVESPGYLREHEAAALVPDLQKQVGMRVRSYPPSTDPNGAITT